MAIDVFIVDDSPEIRSTLEQIVLGTRKEFQLSGSCGSAEEALVLIPDFRPQIVLMDINLGPGKNGIDCIRTLKPHHPDILFLVCTIYEEDEAIFEALQAGASGYLLKKTSPQKLLESIRELQGGGAPMTSQIARKVVNVFQRMGREKALENAEDGPAKPLPVLSNRENEILKLLSRGLLYKEIACGLFISQETVRKHVYHIYEKLHVNNRVEAVNKFFRR
jgi:DNA-binding NarL/FixJ family response regulator